MYDMSVPNAQPGECAKCHGSGEYRWGAVVNGKAQHVGKCHACGGKGHQTAADIKRNQGYNWHKLRSLPL
jgi:DnaJ-class molecular chaperone